MKDTRAHGKSLLRSVFGHFIETLFGFINQVYTQVLYRFSSGLEMACSGNQLLCLYTLTQISGVDVTHFEKQWPTPFNDGDKDHIGSNPTPSPVILSTSPSNAAGGGTKRRAHS